MIALLSGQSSGGCRLDRRGNGKGLAKVKALRELHSPRWQIGAVRTREDLSRHAVSKETIVVDLWSMSSVEWNAS